MFNKLNNIASGWGKWAGIMATSEEEKARSIARMKVCSTCEYVKESKALEFISGGAQQFDTLYCTQCKCPCHQKSLSNDTCRIGKWNFLTTIN